MEVAGLSLAGPIVPPCFRLFSNPSLFSPPRPSESKGPHSARLCVLAPNERMFIQRFGHTAGLGR